MIWTPGHAAEHICLHDAERRILFSGDHVLPKITSHVSLHTWEKRDPLGDYLNSLNKVKDLPVDLILPGHETNFTNLPGRVAQLFKHHEARLHRGQGSAEEREELGLRRRRRNTLGQPPMARNGLLDKEDGGN